MTTNRFFIAAWLCAAAIGLCGTPRTLAQDPAPAETTATATDDQAGDEPLLRQIDERFAQWMPLLLGKDVPIGQSANREELAVESSAQAAVLSLHDAFVTSLTRHVDAADTTDETRAQLAYILALTARQTREARLLSVLSAAQREKFQQFRQLHPQLADDGIHEDIARRTEAVQTLAKLNAPHYLAEPLLLIALRTPDAQTMLAALDLLQHERYRTPDIETTVAHLATSYVDYLGYEDRLHFHTFNSNPRDGRVPGKNARDLLWAWKSSASVPVLLAAFTTPRAHFAEHANVPDLLIHIHDRRSLPVALAMFQAADKKLNDWSDRERMSDNNMFTRSNADMPLYLLLRLTDQSPGDYNMIPRPPGYYGPWPTQYYGFIEGPAREVAFEKFQNWLDRNKDRFADIPTIDVPELTDPSSLGVRWPYAEKNGTPPPRLAETFDVAALREEIARAVTSFLPELNAPRLEARQRAFERLLALHDRMTSPLLLAAQQRAGRADGTVPRYLLQMMAAHSEGLAYTTTLDKPQREKLLRFQRQQDETFRQFFSRYPLLQREAFRALPEGDQAGDAEELLILGLSHPNQDVRWAACAAAANANTADKRYRSDRTVDLLCQRLIEFTHEDNRSVFQRTWTEPNIVRALNVGSPRASATLLDRFKTHAHDDKTTDAYLDALSATRDPRLVPELLALLDQHAAKQDWQRGDCCLYLLLNLTGQSLDVYGLYPRKIDDQGKTVTPMGFVSQTARESAYAKIHAWWQELKDEPPYKNMEPLPPPPENEP